MPWSEAPPLSDVWTPESEFSVGALAYNTAGSLTYADAGLLSYSSALGWDKEQEELNPWD